MKISQPPEKIVKNLCTFLCQDVDETPAFALVMQHEKGFITVKVHIVLRFQFSEREGGES